MARHQPLAAWLTCLLPLLLAGCAAGVRVDNEVRSYAAWEREGAAGEVRLPVAGDHYRFERRPSQREPAQTQDQSLLESLARQALAQVGLFADEGTDNAGGTDPRWRVEVSARSVRLPQAPWEQDAWPGFGLVGRGQIALGRGSLMVAPLGMTMASPHYQREVTLTIRDRQSQRVVYETQAAHDGPWANSPAMWTALLQAALEGFPIPRPGVRQVPLTLPR
jgi:hypothetical protein